MRHAPAGGVLLLVLLASPAPAQPGKDLRVVKLPKAEVYCGPSIKAPFYVTNRLQKGDVVEVVEAMPDGWLKIRPPAGSTSWINTRFLEEIAPDKPNKVVALEGADAPLVAGPADATRERPKVISVKLKRGHQVTSRRVMRDEDGSWMEIDSPQSEPRYIRADAVEQGGTAGDQVGRIANPSHGSLAGLQRSAAPSANLTNAAEEMRRQAVQADLGGNTAEAIRLYDRISSQFAASYPRLVEASRARAAYLRGEDQAPGATHPDAQARGPATGPVRVGSRQDGAPSALPERDPPGTARAVSAGPPSQQPPGWKSYRGRLVVAGYGSIEGRRAYRLESVHRGTWMPLTYVVAGPGVNLEAYVGRGEVEVRGAGEWSGELRANLLEVRQVVPAE